MNEVIIDGLIKYGILALIIFGVSFIFRKPISELILSMKSIKRINKRVVEETTAEYFDENEEKLVIMMQDKTNNKEDDVYNNEESSCQEKDEWRIYYSKEKYEEAYSSLNKEIADMKDEQEIIKNTAILYDIQSMFKYEEAMINFEALVEKNSPEAVIYTTKFLAQERNGKVAEAIDTLRNALPIVNDKVEIVLAIARHYYEKEDYKLAKEAIEENFEKDEYTSYIYFALYTIYEKLDKDEALRLYREGYLTNKLSSEHKVNFAQKLYDAGLLDESLYICQELLDIDKIKKGALLIAGNVYYKLKLYHNALESYMEGLTISNRKSRPILSNIGNIYLSKGLYTKAISYFQEAIDIDKESENAISGLASSIRNRNKENLSKDDLLKNGKKYFM